MGEYFMRVQFRPDVHCIRYTIIRKFWRNDQYFVRYKDLCKRERAGC